jgi:hypothetical protein
VRQQLVVSLINVKGNNGKEGIRATYQLAEELADKMEF